MKLLNIILSIVQILTISTIGLTSNNSENITINTNDTFVNDEVLVTVSCRKKDIYKTFTPSDFPEINCIGVEEIYKIKNSNSHKKVLKIKLANKGKKNILKAIDSLKDNKDILIVEPNFNCFKLESAASEPLLTSEYNWAHEKINLQAAWNIELGNGDLLIGVVDSGISSSHLDLSNNVITNLNIDMNNDNVYDNISSTLDFSPLTSNAFLDQNGHGTSVSGIIGADGNNDYGSAGVCWDIGLVSIKVNNITNSVETSSVSNAISQINQIVSNGIDIPIINLSIGFSSYSDTLRQVFADFPGLIVCSAGNEYKNLNEYPHYPSSFGLNNVITVGASTKFDTIWTSSNLNNATSTDTNIGGEPTLGSNYSATLVDLFAPGDNVLTTFPTDQCSEACAQRSEEYHQLGYHIVSGTSFAAPYVTGVAALLKSYMPSLTTSQIKKIILNTVDKTSNLENYCKTGGRLNAYAALDSHLNGHSYTHSYTWRNKTNHLAYCLCGAVVTTPHAIVSGSNICIKCGGETNGGFVGLLNNNKVVTTNGSYYASNGILVLNEQDLHDYLNGTLLYI